MLFSLRLLLLSFCLLGERWFWLVRYIHACESPSSPNSSEAHTFWSKCVRFFSLAFDICVHNAFYSTHIYSIQPKLSFCLHVCWLGFVRLSANVQFSVVLLVRWPALLASRLLFRTSSLESIKLCMYERWAFYVYIFTLAEPSVSVCVRRERVLVCFEPPSEPTKLRIR